VNVDEPSAAEMISMAAERPAVTIDVSNIPARLIVETVEQPHLPEIYEELLSFDGNEFYISDSLKQMGLNDMSFASAWRSFKDSVAVGILRANNQLELAPGAGTQISAEDRLVMVAEDDSTIRPSTTEDGP